MQAVKLTIILGSRGLEWSIDSQEDWTQAVQEAIAALREWMNPPKIPGMVQCRGFWECYATMPNGEQCRVPLSRAA